MLVTLIPLFDENLTVSAYSLFTQKHNYLLHPNYLGTGQNDGASRIEGLEVMEAMGIETLSPTCVCWKYLNLLGYPGTVQRTA